MPWREVPVRDSITQLEQRFEQFRTTRRRADEAAGGVVAGGVEQARQHGVNVVAHALRLD